MAGPRLRAGLGDSAGLGALAQRGGRGHPRWGRGDTGWGRQAGTFGEKKWNLAGRLGTRSEPGREGKEGRARKKSQRSTQRTTEKKKKKKIATKAPVPTFAGGQRADPGAVRVGGCSLLYEMFGSAGAICILSLAPVSSKEGESSLRDQLPLRINYLKIKKKK